MRLRHKLPNVFGLYMVDVLCCSLGCVILLWLFNDYKSTLLNRDLEARGVELARLTEEQRARAAELALAKTRLEEQEIAAQNLTAELDDRQKDLEKLGRDIFALNDRLRAEQGSRATTEKDLGSTRTALRAEEEKNRQSVRTMATDATRLADLRRELQTRLALLTVRDLELAGLRLKKGELEAQARAQGERALKLEEQVAKATAEADRGKVVVADIMAARDKADQQLTLGASKMAELEKLLAATVAARTKAEKARDDTEKALSTTMIAREKTGKTLDDKVLKVAELEDALTRETRRRRAVEDEMQAIGRKVAETDAEKNRLTIDLSRLKSRIDARFEGIELTGKRVVFAVDMSGSMVLLDSVTPAGGKWAEVGRVLGRLMDSLPELESYQVLVFAENARWLFGEDTWRKFQAGKSSAEVVTALSALQPKGGTNLHTAMEQTFTLRSAGLDSVYLLSDGLPNQGPGLDANQERTLTEGPRGELLGRRVRQQLTESWNAPVAGGERPVRIHTIGFFYESPDLGAFLWSLARENRGRFVGMSSP
ncbi:MAG: VWA domain-containing protein [Planctomycetota bacterium]|nr:VWA domain-containing protein [Planctomycetota bacterium]